MHATSSDDEDVSEKIMLAELNRTLDEWLCDSFAELIEDMEMWKWDDATWDFWWILAKALQQSSISVTWAEQLDSRLASVHITGKMSWAAATRSIGVCKMAWKNRRVAPRYRFRGMGSRSNNMGADVGKRICHSKEHYHYKASWIWKVFPTCPEFSWVIKRKH